MADVQAKLSSFCRRVEEQIEQIVLQNFKNGKCTDPYAADKNPDRAWCDAAELLAMFEKQNSFVYKVELLQALKAMEQQEIGYNILCVGYALECFGSHFEKPITKAEVLKGETLSKWLEKQYARDSEWVAWGAGSDVDALGSAFYQNKKYFDAEPDLKTLFDWLNSAVNPAYGMWGSGENILDMVNGFYRLTRGTYAQFNVDLPLPEKTIDTVLAHAKILNTEQHITACNTLDIIHPLWLCKKQTDYRADEGKGFALTWIEEVLNNWTDNKGFSFMLHKHSEASMMGTEMWLSILYLLCDYAGLSHLLTFSPKGVHRLYTEI
ncbi:MAG: hypothetical protein IJE10_03230 [Clostridia bacterium]|nr:hypothetical protein [Clostridia bacterium]